jgi:hypothetical protein
MQQIHLGKTTICNAAVGSSGGYTERDGEPYYRICGFDTLPPFFMTVVSHSDHWMFVSSTGGLTCGRRDPGNALFPYTTDDKIHDASATTGPKTFILVDDGDRKSLWMPFGSGPDVYRVERRLYKNGPGNKLVFEEVNHDLGLSFSYTWSSSEQFGFTRKSQLHNTGSGTVDIEILDGLRNLLPWGITRSLQNEMSSLADAFKQAEVIPGQALGVYHLSSVLTDRAEPSEALKASVAWCVGLDDPDILLSEDQLAAFCTGTRPVAETFSKGKRGAFFVHNTFSLDQQSHKSWYLLADVAQGPSQLAALSRSIDAGVAMADIEADIHKGTGQLQGLVGRSDGFQKSSDALLAGRHFSNTLFNIMRGGVFHRAYEFPARDFLEFASTRNRSVGKQFRSLLKDSSAPLTLESALALALGYESADMQRLVLEYLPLTFSRRHGDPSRPWNHFSIDLKNDDGSPYLYYQGNWRDIFQNWEALAISYPEYIESFIAKFVNASTADGYNPYRISRNGFDWETLEPDNPWSNIGYWGDHQVGYLLKFLELSQAHHPARLAELLEREIFVYANVPYRIKPYRALLDDPRNTVEYDDERAGQLAARAQDIGGDGKLVIRPDGSIYRVNLLEKLLVPALVKISNFVPGGGIWMNTQRPEWNDANNALVGYGLSMVTLCYLRRYLNCLDALLQASTSDSFKVSSEVSHFFSGLESAFRNHATALEDALTAGERKQFMDDLGLLGEQYRASVYPGFCGDKLPMDKQDLLTFMGEVCAHLDRSIGQNQRADGLFNSYNLAHFDDDGYRVEVLEEMLEGQVAVLSSGVLDAGQCLELLNALKNSHLYREDQNSYLLYPDRELPLFGEKNVIPESLVIQNDWIQSELASGRIKFVEQDVNGDVHFNGDFRNTAALLDELQADLSISGADADAVCRVYEAVFNHQRFTGRSGTMYKYEGLGSIYWHMVSKLLLASAEVIETATAKGVDGELLEELCCRFDEIRNGIGVHKTPAQYGAIPTDPYSHTPSFTGVQQPGLTGQVKEDVISRFKALGVRVSDGRLSFDPVQLSSEEFLREPESWTYSTGGPEITEKIDPGCLAFTIYGIPVIYRIADAARVEVTTDDQVLNIEGSALDYSLSQSLFRREGKIGKLRVDVVGSLLRE